MAARTQKHIRDNTMELREFLNDLQDWEQSVKEKDKKLKSQACGEEKANLPPVRGRVPNSGHLPVRRTENSSQPLFGSPLGVKEREGKSYKDGHTTKSMAANHTYDYFRDKWDKFDVDAALKEVDEREEGAPPRKPTTKEMKTSSKPMHMKNPFQRGLDNRNSGRIEELSSVFRSDDNASNATSEKEQGNECFKAKKYPEAIDCYSRSILLYPTAVAFANRAMAYIKIRRFEDAEYDCNEAINLDDRYVKAYSRRGTARRELGKLLDAIEDFEFALRLEPDNKELQKLYVETRALYQKKIGKKLTEGKVPVVIQEITSSSTANAAEKSHIEADRSIMIPNAEGGSSATSDSTLSKDSMKMEDDPRKNEKINVTDEKVPIIIQEATISSAENATEMSWIEVDKNMMIPNAQGGSSANSDSAFTKDSMKMEVDSRKVEINVKKKHVVVSQKEDSQISTKEALDRAASRAMAAAKQNITAPKSAYEFEVLWEGFTGDHYAQAKLLQVMAPSSLPKVFKDALTTPLFMDIIRCVKFFFMENVDFGIQFLENLTRVSRFDITVLCLSSNDKAELRQIWDELITNVRVPDDFREALNKLCSKYCPP